MSFVEFHLVVFSLLFTFYYLNLFMLCIICNMPSFLHFIHLYHNISHIDELNKVADGQTTRTYHQMTISDAQMSSVTKSNRKIKIESEIKPELEQA